MGIVSYVLKRGLLDENYPAECPSISLSKDDQSLLNQGKCVCIVDTHYNEPYYVFKKEMSKSLSKENLEIRVISKIRMDLNKVRQEELSLFYKNNPKYKQD